MFMPTRTLVARSTKYELLVLTVNTAKLTHRKLYHTNFYLNRCILLNLIKYL